MLQMITQRRMVNLVCLQVKLPMSSSSGLHATLWRCAAQCPCVPQPQPRTCVNFPLDFRMSGVEVGPEWIRDLQAVVGVNSLGPEQFGQSVQGVLRREAEPGHNLSACRNWCDLRSFLPSAVWGST